MVHYTNSYANDLKDVVNSFYISDKFQYARPFERDIIIEYRSNHSYAEKINTISSCIRKEKIRQAIEYCSKKFIPEKEMEKIVEHLDEELVRNSSTIIWYRDPMLSKYVGRREVSILKKGIRVTLLKTADYRVPPNEELRFNSPFLNRL